MIKQSAIRVTTFLLLFIIACAAERAVAESGQPAMPLAPKVSTGFTIELVASTPLVERPIVGSFDEEGRLYVAESSGSNDPVEKQLAERPHRIVRLEDVDNDGKFDRRVVFADRMMFPEGVQYLDGSLYVSAPPSIWKLTDTDGDGVADERVEWFRGKTLTGCANDLHGPYLGPDGWLYWCKGGFAEQTHVVRGREWTTRAAHIFRCRPDGSGFEAVMTGGMDNPVDVVFTSEGERILSATYLVGEGRRDGLVHAIYGGVYGKEHGVLDGHPRTGELMPLLVSMSPTAPCGLERYDSSVFGAGYRDNLFACQFNMRKVSRHVLSPHGSTFTSEDSDFVTSDNVDFHPTDVLLDADGSLLVIDTGGWYKLCCPTSQLWKPNEVGGIYRVRRAGVATNSDPRGRNVAWEDASAQDLWAYHGDARPAVRLRASRQFLRSAHSKEIEQLLAELVQHEDLARIQFVPSKPRFKTCDVRTTILARTWTLGQMDDAAARRVVRQLLQHDDESVRHAAISLVSLHRDRSAYQQLLEILKKDTPANRRAAAEALGRLGNVSAVRPLLDAAGHADDRVLQHSITYALIELADLKATRTGIADNSPKTRAVALIALDQMPEGQINPHDVTSLLNAGDEALRDTARWLVSLHPEWGGALHDWLREQLANLPTESTDDAGSAANERLERMLTEFATHASIQDLLSRTVTSEQSPDAAKQIALSAMARAKLNPWPPAWRNALATVIERERNDDLVLLAVAAARETDAGDDALTRSLQRVASTPKAPTELRVTALAAAASSFKDVSDPQFDLLVLALSAENSVTVRTAAAEALAEAPLTTAQLERLTTAIECAGPLELNHLLEPFTRNAEDAIGLKLLTSLNRSSALSSLRVDLLRMNLAKYGTAVQQEIDKLETRINVDAISQRRRIEELLPKVATGDVERGLQVFHSSKAACSSCHVLGHAGGTVGPELTHIGKTRTERDLLEAILYPSLSFVRSYEPMSVITMDGRTINGTIRSETDTAYVISTGPDQEVRVAREEVEQIDPSRVSVMPSGLDGQLTAQELADLVAFLKSTGQP